MRALLTFLFVPVAFVVLLMMFTGTSVKDVADVINTAQKQQTTQIEAGMNECIEMIHKAPGGSAEGYLSNQKFTAYFHDGNFHSFGTPAQVFVFEKCLRDKGLAK